MNYRGRTMNWNLISIARKLGLRFREESGGNVAAIFALALVPVVSLIGAVVDYSNASAVESSLRVALDAAVIAGAGDTSSTQNTTALIAFNGNFVPRAKGVTSVSPIFTSNNDGTYSGNASASVPTMFMGIAGIESVNVSAKSVAAVATIPSPSNARCIIGLNPTAQSAIDDSASSAINASQCIIQVNSSNAKAVTLSGSAQINAAENCFVGKATTSGSAKITPSPDAVCTPMTDPFAKMNLPPVGPCDYTNYKPKNNETLQPSLYCGGLNISSVTVTFAPGLYIIKDGLLQPSGGSVLTGNGVSFFLTGHGAGVQTSGGSSWHISAMKTGYLAGFVFFLDPGATPASSSELSGTSELYFEGVLYFAKQQLRLSGGSDAYATAPFTAYIADTFVLSGSSNLNINSDATKTTVPIPSALLTGGTGGKLWLVM